MAPSRRRGPSGKTSATAARSAAIQAAEKRRREEQEHQAARVNNSSSKSNNNNDGGKTSTAKSVDVANDTLTELELRNNTTTTVAVHAEAGKKRKKFALLPPFPGDIGISTTTSTASSSSSPAPRVVVATAKQVSSAGPYCKVVPEDRHRSRQGKMIYKRKQDFDYSEGEDEFDDEDDDDEEDEGCLHCREKVKDMPRIRIIDDDDDDNDSNEGYGGESNIQVRCDDCRGYICNSCHWCHEFQANHEIRVCDRCDAFYCRNCDEMDQCDDCGEVVCGSCSTLLSCKFCGGGLCEECATACGRCGIVLCSRDAKFAVDCDTCRLSYCLVCLASGSKDPCVRCGHRPSKRMEQLVHLRLKSIYKAFKSSSSNTSAGGGSGNNSTYDGGKGDGNNFQSRNSKDDDNGGRSRRNKPTTLQDMVKEHDDEDPWMMGPAGVLPHKLCRDLEQNYLAEQKKADAAAEALLAEIEEEETAMAQKKSKKKKKKERKNANKQPKPSAKSDTGGDEREKSGDDVVAKIEAPQNDVAMLNSRDDDRNADPLSEIDSADKRTKVDGEIDNTIEKAEETKIDPVEKKLVDCVKNFDTEGIESILFRLKGVPGRAGLRKNAKKALKRLKLELNPPQPTPLETKEETVSKTERKSTAPIHRPSHTADKVLPVVVDSRISSKKTATKSNVHHEKSNITKSPRPKASSRKNNGSNRCEASVEIVSRLVGWMIGKNGQRIRDLMEESGAKIWIDQEKFKGQETRNVYISGDRKSVDQAVLLVNDVITNAPPPQGMSNTISEATALMTNMAISSKRIENPAKATGLTSPPPTHTAQPAVPSTVEVKSAWAKASGSSFGVDKMSPGTIPKPPVLISSSVPVAAEKANESSKAETASEPRNVGSGINEGAPRVLMTVPKIGVDGATPAIDASIASNPQHKSDEVTTEIVTCDVRFVPLLIGKRGWTIKNIQDDSGARVDIDQTVTPRQVRISGSKENVDKAVTMVRDVLSYPHAQLQSSSENMVNDERGIASELGMEIPLSEVPVLVPSPTKQKLLAASAVLEHDVIRNSMSRQGEISERIHSPPPLVGDAKSAISASSSLSSTPDPSIASSKKGFISSHMQNGPLLPLPAEHFNIANIPSQQTSRQFLQSEGGIIDDGVDGRGLWVSAGVGPAANLTGPPQSSYADNAGQIAFQSGRPIAIPHGAPAHPQGHQFQQASQHLQVNNSMLREQLQPQVNPNHHQHQIAQSFVPSGQLSHTISLQANPNGGLIDRSSQFSNQNIANNQHDGNMHSSLGGAPPYNLYSNDGAPGARAIATTPLRDLMHHTGVGSGHVVSSPPKASGFVDNNSRLWNSGNPSYPAPGLPPQAPGLQPQAPLGFSATSIGFSPGPGHHRDSIETGARNSLGYTNAQAIPSQQPLQNVNPLSAAANTSTSFSNSMQSGLRNEDSQMINSLFGGVTNVQSPNVTTTNGLMTNFNGLSLPSDGDGAKSSGLWDLSDLSGAWRDTKGNAENGGGADAPNVSSIGNIFSNEIPPLSQDRPQESRFNWNSTNSNR